jgi:opacity protein-like surface antigen
MANGYWDFTVPWPVKPYVGVGLGWASNKVDDVEGNDGGFIFKVPGGTKSDVAWALMAGVSWPINPTLTLDIGYRYSDLGKIETDSGNITFGGVPVGTYSGASGKLQAHKLMIGLRF